MNDEVLRGVIYVLWFYFCFFEMKQMLRDGSSYFWKERSIFTFNYVDMGSAILNGWVMIEHDLSHKLGRKIYETETKQTMASIAVFLMWVKAFHWMRLFDKFAFFNRLIGQTFRDVVRFIFIYLMIICAFANVIYISNYKRIISGEERVFDQYTSNDVVNSFINLYSLGLGDF